MPIPGSHLSVFARAALALAVATLATGACKRTAAPAPEAASAEAEQRARLVALDVGLARGFWSCMFGKDVDVGQLANGQQVRRLLGAAYGGARQRYPEHVLRACVPELERAQAAFAASPLAAQNAAYAASLARLRAAVPLYAERMRGWHETAELDEMIPEHAREWYEDGEAAQPRPEALAYGRFLRCAVPELDTLKDGQAIYDHLASGCFRGNPVAFMARVRGACVPLLQNADEKARPTSAFRTTRKRLRDPESRQVQAWESCVELAEEQRTLKDASELVAAADAYLGARPR